MLKYKGYMISGCSIPMYMQGCQSRGSVCKAGRTGSVIELQRIEGTNFFGMSLITLPSRSSGVDSKTGRGPGL